MTFDYFYRVFSQDAPVCVDELPKEKVSSIVAKISQKKMFVLDVPLGCSDFILNKYMAAIAAILQVVLC